MILSEYQVGPLIKGGGAEWSWSIEHMQEPLLATLHDYQHRIPKIEMKGM